MAFWIALDTLVPEVTKVCDKVFVYGTLREGFPLHQHLASTRPRLLGPGVIHGRLYDLGEYPGAFPSTSPRDEIHGEVYVLADASNQLRELDEVEEFRPQRPAESLFLRCRTEVQLEAGGSVEAWVYFLPREPVNARLIPGGDYSNRTSAPEPSPERGTDVSPPRIGLTTTKPDSDKFANYVRAIEHAGGEAVPVLPGGKPAEDVLEELDALVLTGGGDIDPALYRREKHSKTADVDRARDDLEVELVRLAKDEGLPTLCVCRGLQVLNVALNGTLTQHLPDEVGEGVPHVGAKGKDGLHRVDVEKGSHLSRILGTTQTSPASSHHQAIDDLAPGLRVVARSPDDGVIEAVEAEGHPWLIGVQWHPERSSEPCQQRLFADLVRAAKERRAEKSKGPR